MDATETRLARAQSQIAAGNARAALETLVDASADDRHDPQVAEVVARAHLHLDEHEQALEVARKGLAVAPHHPPLLAARAAGEWLGGDLASAERTLLEGLRRDRRNVELLCLYSHVLLDGGQTEKAILAQREAAVAAPQHPAVLRTAALIAHTIGDSERKRQAVTLLRESDADSSQSFAASALGAAYGNDDQLRHGMHHFLESVRSDSSPAARGVHDDDLLRASLQDSPVREGEQPWSLRWQPLVALLGGIVAVTAVALINLRRYGAPARQQRLAIATGLLGLAATLSYVAVVDGSGLHIVPRLLGLAFYIALYRIQQPFDAVWRLYRGQRTESFLVPGIAWTLVGAVTLAAMIMAVPR